jgi:hypothetical protein
VKFYLDHPLQLQDRLDRYVAAVEEQFLSGPNAARV